MEELIAKMKSLPEIELLEFMEALGEHLAKNKMEGLIDQVFEVDQERIEELEDEIEELKEKIESAIDRLS